MDRCEGDMKDRNRVTEIMEITECGEVYLILRGGQKRIDEIKAKIASITEYEEVLAMDWRWGNRVEKLKRIGLRNKNSRVQGGKRK